MMKALISVLLIMLAGSASAQYQRQLIEAPSGTQGRPIQRELETVGTVMSVFSEQMEVTVGYTCPDGFVAPGRETSVVNPGTVIGGVLGGATANHIGGGTGKTLATIAGTVAGGYAGNEVYKRMNNVDDPRARRAEGMPGECYAVKKMVPVYVHRVAIHDRLQVIDRPARPDGKLRLVEMTNVRSFTKFAIGEQVSAKIQINYFVDRLD
jgi:hypothetical protein